MEMHRLRIDKDKVFIDDLELIGKKEWVLECPSELARLEMGELTVTLFVRTTQEKT